MSTFLKKYFKILIILIGLLIIVWGLCYFYSPSKSNVVNGDGNVDDNKIKYENLTKDLLVDGVLFTNINASYDGNVSLITYTVVNKTDKPITLGEYDVIVRDVNGNILTTFTPILSEEIAPSKSIDTGNAVDVDLTDAYAMELSLSQ